MDFYPERKRKRLLSEAEARGEDVWIDDIPRPAAVKIGLAWGYIYEDADPWDEALGEWTLPASIDEIALHQMGEGLGLGRTEDVAELSRDDIFFVVEAVHHGLKVTKHKADAEQFAKNVVNILRSYRVKYQFVADTSQIVPLESFEMHTAVVEPTLSLLHGRPDLAGALGSYEDALKEIARGKPADAITDAGTALQQVLEGLGCEGNKLGQLIPSAKNKGLFGQHDGKLADGITTVMHWASANRSERGDAHNAGSDVLDDAWLMVHIVGALIIRLSMSQND